MGKRRCHPTRLGLVRLAAEQRVEPDQPVAAEAEAGHLATELIGVTSIPAVADDQDDGAMTEHPTCVVALERVQRVGDARPAADVVHLVGNVVERGVDVAVAEQVGDSGQMCRKREGLDALAPADRMREHEQVARVSVHRTADVAEDHDRPALGARARAREALRVAALARRGSHGAAQLDRAATIGAQAPGPSLRDPPRRLAEQPAHRRELVPAHLAKVALAEQLLGAVPRARGRRSLDLTGDTRR